MDNTQNDLEKGRPDSESSLSDSQVPTEMQNPLNHAPPTILENMNNDSISLINPSRMVFSDDEASSAESSVAKPTAIPEFGDRGDEVDDGLDDCSDCGSMAADTMRYSRAKTSAGREEPQGCLTPASGVSMQDVDLSMEDVDLGSTNRIMALRESKNNMGGRGVGGDNDGGKTIVEGSTAEPSPSMIMPGDGPSSGGDLTEVGVAL